MKHTTHITPLNCKSSAFTTATPSFFHTDITTYNNATQRAVYFKDITTSWFRLKTRDLSPYIEPSVKDLVEGDVVTFEFDINFLSGTPDFKVQLFYLGQNRETLRSETYQIESRNMPPVGQFKRFKVDILVYNIPSNTSLFVFNLRPNGTNNECIVKNIEMTVNTSNNKFSMAENVIVYKDNHDYRKMLKIYSQTDIIDTYKPLNTYGNNIVSNNQIDFTALPAGKFKGIMGEFIGNPSHNTIILYFEYWMTLSEDVGSGISITSQAFDADNNPLYSTKPSLLIPRHLSTKWETFYEIVNLDNPNIKHLVFDVGNVGVQGSFKIRNIHVSAPRYDAEKKELPNSIENLFSTLELV